MNLEHPTIGSTPVTSRPLNSPPSGPSRARRLRLGGSAFVFSCLLALSAGVVSAQTRSRTVLGWGESILGLNQAPKLPTGVTQSDVDALASGELVNAVVLRSGITVGGSPYMGSRFIVSGAGGVSGDENGRITYGNGSTPYTDYTSWNEALIARDGSVSLQRVAFGFLHAVVVRTQRQQFVGNDYPGDLAFIGDRLGGYFPAVNTGDASPMTERYVAVATSATHALALRSTGVVNGFGGINFFGETTVPSGVVGAVGVAAGEYFSAALLATGQVVVWGAEAFGVLQVPVGATNVVSLKAGASHLVALRADGTVLAWGNTADGRTAVPSGLRNVREIAVGRAHSLALREDGTVVAWGYNGSGQTSIPATLSNVIDIAAGGNHSLALVSMERPMLTGINGELGRTTFNLATDYVERGRTLTLQAGLGNGAPPVQYRWRKNGVLISGATGPSVEVAISTGEADAFQVDVEAINAFGNDQRSGTVRVGSGPSELAVRIGLVGGGSAQNLSPNGVGGIWVPTGGGFTAFGRNPGGVYLTPVDTSSEAIFEVKSRGNPAPVVELWNADTSTLICGPATVTGASTSAQGQQYLKPGISLTTPLTNGRYLVVVKSSVGRALTNEVTLSVHPVAAAPVITSSLPRVTGITGLGGGVPTTLPVSVGPVASGTAGVSLSVDPGYTVPSGSSLQWLREGVEIPGATNSTLTLGAFSYALAKPYSLRIRTPLYGTSLAADAAKGQAVSTTLTPVLPVTVGLSKSNISGAAGTKGDIEVSLAGSLTARIRFEKQALNGTWALDASLLGDLTSQAQPPSVNWRGWTDPKEFWANLDGFSGQLKLRVGGTLSSSMRGNYRLVTAQLSHLPQNPNPLEGAAVLDGTEQYSYFTVTVTEPASLSVPTTPPTPVVGGGNWVAGVGNGVDMSLSARAYSTVDLGSYLTTAGTPSPNFQWEKQNSSGQFVSVSGFTNTSRLTVAATPANAGIYRVTATNAVGGAGGVSKLVALSVDRVLVLTNNAMVFPDATVEIPISVVGFGDESAVSFTLDVVSPYLSANVGNIAVALDAALVSSTDLSFRTSGSVDATPVAGGASGAGANRIRVQVQVSRKDPAQRSFPAGTNRLGVLTFKAQTVNNIATIRNVTAPAVAPPLGVPISVLGTLGASDLALRIALTNASLASVVADPGSVMVLADSLEGDVDNSFAVNVVDITTIASVLASGQLGGSYSSPLAASRLDCAPRESSGDRFINLADLVQVARYVAKLDPAQPQADPPGSGSIVLNAPSVRDPRVTRSGLTPSRRIRFGWSDVVAGSAVRIPVVLEGEGDENAMAFNVEFDPAVLVYNGLQTPVGTSQMENAVSAAQGRIGVVLWKGAGKAIPAGGSIVAELEFMVRATGGMTVMRFGSIPVDSMIATVSAQPVLDVTYEPASFTIGSRPRVVGGRIVSHRTEGQIWTVELRPQDSTGATVSAANRRLRLWMADQIETPEGSWQPSSDRVEVTPAGTLRIPITLRPDQAQQFFRIREE